MGLYQLFQSLQFVRTKSAALGEPDGIEPKLCLVLLALNMNVWRFIAITSIKEESIRTAAQHARHQSMLRCDGRSDNFDLCEGNECLSSTRGCSCERCSLRPHFATSFMTPCWSQIVTTFHSPICNANAQFLRSSRRFFDSHKKHKNTDIRLFARSSDSCTSLRSSWPICQIRCLRD